MEVSQSRKDNTSDSTVIEESKIDSQKQTVEWFCQGWGVGAAEAGSGCAVFTNFILPDEEVLELPEHPLLVNDRMLYADKSVT